jgi:hypothetical protein
VNTKPNFTSNSWNKAASSSGSDREPSRLAARRKKPNCPENHNPQEPCGPLRAGTARGPVSLMQPCS